MAWIESHTVLSRHRKVLLMAHDLGIDPIHLIGHLTVFWHTALEQQEDGDLSDWPDSMIEQAAGWKGEGGKFLSALRHRGWLDGHLVHDWLDYVGPYLIKKYSSGNVERLKQIWKRHGYKYGKGKGKYHKQQASEKRVESERKERLPNPSPPNPSEPDLTKPNLTVVGGSAHERKLGELEALSLSEELQSWAQQEFGVSIPQDVLEEFKAYWREQKKLRTDWTATLKSRVRQLVSRGVLKPKKFDLKAWGQEEGQA